MFYVSVRKCKKFQLINVSNNYCFWVMKVFDIKILKTHILMRGMSDIDQLIFRYIYIWAYIEGMIKKMIFLSNKFYFI